MKTSLVFLSLLFSTLSFAEFNPQLDENFLMLSSGQDLRQVRVRNIPLSVTKGKGRAFGVVQQREFESIQRYAQTPQAEVQYKFVELDTGRVIEQSLNPERVFFGASVSKTFVAGALLNHNNGRVNDANLLDMAKMLVVSNNQSWFHLQRVLGDGSKPVGQQRNWDFSRGLDLPRTRGFQGWYGEVHGNELLVTELIDYLAHIYQENFKGAKDLWKIMYTCRTGASKALKYLPRNLPVGGKTGTYGGPTVDPRTGENITVDVHNHMIFFFHNEKPYGLAVLTNRGKDEDVALIAGGLYKKYLQ